MNGKRIIVVGLILWLTGWHGLPAMGAARQAAPTPPRATGPSPLDTQAPMTDIHDIRPPVPVGFHAPWMVPSLLVLAAALILAALWWRRRHREKRAIATIVPELPPEMIAVQALDEISDVRLQDGRAFYFRLSAIVRQYVSGRFAVGASEMTTEEFVPCIDRLPLDRGLAGALKQLCRTMDPVKFGAGTAMEKQMAADLGFVRAFVRETAPKAQPPNPPGDASADRSPIQAEG